MKIQDLMINDCVEWMGNYYCKVDLPLLMTEYQDNVDSEFVKPIPLTVEILEKNGFEKVEESSFVIKRIDFFVKLWIMPLCVEFEYQSYFDTNEMRIVIEYVHELQHALRLCGLNELANNFKI